MEGTRRGVLATALGIATGSVGVAGDATGATAGDADRPPTDPAGQADASAAATTPGRSPAGWPAHRVDAANTGAKRAVAALAPPLRDRWTAEPLFSGGRRLVVAARGSVFVVNDEPGDGRPSLRARAAVDGAVRWRFSPPGGRVDGTPAVAGGTVYVGGDALYAVDAARGREHFRFAPGADRVGTPTVVEGTALVASDRALHAVDATTGDERWRVPLPGRSRWPPAVAGGVASVGTHAGTLGVDVATGEVRWRSDPGGGLTAVADGVVIATGGETLAALSASDGRPLWRLDPPDGVVVTAPVVAGGRVFAVSDTVVATEWDRGVHGFDLATGREVWHRDLGVRALFEVATNTLAAAGDALYVGGVNGSVTALDAATGRSRWRAGVDAPAVVAPVVADGGLYLVGHPNDVARRDAGFVRAVVETLPDRLVVEAPDRGVARYRFSVTGAVERTDGVGAAPVPGRATVDPEDNVHDRTARGAVGDGGLDAYRFRGAIADGRVDHGATVYLNGERLPAFPPSALPRSLAVASDGSGVARYWLRVDGPLAKATGVGDLPVGGRPTADDEDVLAGRTVTGAVAGGGRDAYRFAGTLVATDVRGPATVHVTGDAAGR